MGYYYSKPQDPLIALIVDPELHARQRLSRLLRELAPEFTGIAEASNDTEAITKIERFTPDLLFISYPVSARMQQELFSGYARNVPKVLLCKDPRKARTQIETFGGFYLTKPVDAQHLLDLLDALSRYKNGEPGQMIHHDDGSNGNGRSYLNRLVVRRQNQFRLLPVDRVVWFGTEFRLVYAYTDRRRYPIDLGLEQLEHRLDPNLFVRVHRSAIVNVNRIKEIIPTSGGRCKIMLDDHQERILPLSASRAKEVKHLLRDKIVQR